MGCSFSTPLSCFVLLLEWLPMLKSACVISSCVRASKEFSVVTVIFSEVAHLHRVFWLDIGGTIRTQLLSKRTKYVVYLMFKLAEEHWGLENANAFVRFVNRVS
ncbi:hypothetical protein AABB24_020144 [Solanum stoloniferum]|uniref:Secreted protein n=1 Tax=Solanum stoloniferum TaxID=62892 RepID=A0ABD2T6R1_9SOLN